MIQTNDRTNHASQARARDREFIRENQPHFAIGLNWRPEENFEPLNQLERRTDDLDEDNVNK